MQKNVSQTRQANQRQQRLSTNIKLSKCVKKIGAIEALELALITGAVVKLK